MINRNDQPWETKAPAFERDMRQALALDPSQYTAQAGLIFFYALNGQWSELSAQIERALHDNPTNTLVLNTAALPEGLQSYPHPEGPPERGTPERPPCGVPQSHEHQAAVPAAYADAERPPL